MRVSRGNEVFEVAEGHEWFWPGFSNGTWEPSTFKIFDRFLSKDETFLDIGAWIGPTVLYAASRAKKVFAFEPDPIAFFKLLQNLDLNKIKNVVPYRMAVSDQWKGINFGSRTQFGDSMSSEMWGEESGMQVPAAAFSALVSGIKPTFIKIDIEGGEKNIFDSSMFALMQHKPTIHLSLHTPWHKGDVNRFAEHICHGLRMYPYFYDENLSPIKIEAAFDPNIFNSIVATFEQL